MPDLLLHPIATLRGDFADMGVAERVTLLALLPVAAALGAIVGTAAIVALLTLLPI